MHKTAISLAIASLTLSGAALAQNALEEVVVTAQKRAESIQDTPISMNAFAGDTLSKMGVTSVIDIDKTVPNVLLTPFPASRTATTAFIRGIGNSDLQVTKDTAVGIYVDGVYLGRATGLATDIADLERVEVLRGPQGTLYGRNTTGGAINMITTKPEQELQFKQQFSFGNRDYWRSQTTVNLPVTDQLAARVAYLASEKGGWVKNAGIGRDFGEDEKEAGRIALRWTLADELTVDYVYDRSRMDGGMLAQQITSADAGDSFVPYVRKHRMGTLSVLNGRDGVEDTVAGHALTVNWDVSDTLSIKSITAVRNVDAFSFSDFSASVNYLNRQNAVTPPVTGLLPRGAEVLDFDMEGEQEQVTQELQFIGEALDSRLEYVAGLYYFHEQGSEAQNGTQNNVVALSTAQLASFLPFVPSLQPIYDQLAAITWSAYHVKAKAESLAAFGQFGYTPAILNDRLTLTLGLRFTKDEREANKLGRAYEPGFLPGTNVGDVLEQWRQQSDRDSSRFTPSLVAEFDLTDNVNLYAKYSEAYRAGGFNTRATRDTFANGFGPEDLTAYEIGMKSDLLDSRLRVNAAVFRYVYEDLQVDQNIPGNIAATTTVNAGKAEMDGAELDVTALLTEGLTLTASYGYLNSEYKEFFDVDSVTGQLVDVANERHRESAPQESYTVALDYVFPHLGFGELSARLQYHWEDASWFSTDGDARRSSYNTLDASLQLAEVKAGEGQVRVQLWGRNLENREYALHSTDFGSFMLTYFNEPRSYGMDVAYEF